MRLPRERILQSDLNVISLYIDKLFVNKTKTHLIQYTYLYTISEKNPGACVIFPQGSF